MEDEFNIEDWLVENYRKFKKNDIIKMFNISAYKLKSIARKLNLTDKVRADRIAIRNKKMGRDLSYDKLKEIALKYRTRAEFQLLDNSAYTTSRRMGILDDICAHMIKLSYSIPQLILSYILKNLLGEHIYNDRVIIKPYEIDIYYPEYNLGFEYDGLGWHLNKDDSDKYMLISNKNIIVIKIVENSRKYEEDIKSQLILYINVINEITNKNISESDINNILIDYSVIFSEIIDDNELKLILLKYNTYSEFRKNNINLYNKLSRLKMLNKIELSKQKTFWSHDKLIDEISKYSKLSDFIENSNPCYLHIKRNNLEYMLIGLERIKYYTVDECINELKVNPYKTKYQLRKNNPKLYDRLKRKIGLDELGKLLLDFYPKAD